MQFPAMRDRWQPSTTRQILWFLGLVGICFTVAGVGGAVTLSSVNDWYPTLRRPSWTPPNWLFGPVWTTLYFMMAISSWLVWRRGGFQPAKLCLGLFFFQLALNALWSLLFFGMRSPEIAFYEIVLLWLSIAVTLLAFWRHSALAALLLVPYLAWTTLATVLNFTIWMMN